MPTESDSARYRRRAAFEAFRVGTRQPQWFRDALEYGDTYWLRGGYQIKSLEHGARIAREGDWIVRDGDFLRAYTSEEFEREFEVVA